METDYLFESRNRVTTPDTEAKEREFIDQETTSFINMLLQLAPESQLMVLKGIKAALTTAYNKKAEEHHKLAQAYKEHLDKIKGLL